MEFGSAALKLTSPGFMEGQLIPEQYTCDGADVSPPLAWSPGPEETRSYALIMDDPDAPGGTFTHWVMFNIPADVHSLPENVAHERTLANKARQGKNDFHKIGYGGPCPPEGLHRYFIRVYALSVDLDLEGGISKHDLVRAIQGRVLAEGMLIGTYER